MATQQEKEVNVEIFTAGDGINYPKKCQTVCIHYTGYLPGGLIFDSVRLAKFI